jgi:hypothetical protein
MVTATDEASRFPDGPRNLVLGTILLQAVAGLALGLPGHMSVDSIVQLFEARTLQFISFHPPMMSLLLRVLDSWIPGTALFVILDQALLTASFALLVAERGSTLRWPAALAAAALVLNPVLIAYTGIVWKDVLMPHLTAFGYVCLFVAGRRPMVGTRTAWALSAVLALALAASLRQHALALAIPGAAYAAILLTGTRARRWGLALLFPAAVVGVNLAIVAYADAVGVGPRISRTEVGLRSLIVYDFAGIAANGGTIPDPALAAQVRTTQAPFYTPLRIDTLPALAPASPLWRMETSEMESIWLRSIVNSPGAYLLHRMASFGALLWKSGTPSLCAPTPFFLGVEPTAFVPLLGRDIVPELGLRTGSSRRERVFQDFLLSLPTPLFNHAFWSIVLIAAAIAWWRRGGADPLVVFAAGAIVFAFGFAVIGIACEFRYLYVLPVAATVLLFALVAGSRRAGADGTARA